MPTPKNPGDRTKAHRLRRLVKSGEALQPIDQLWLAEYDENDAKGTNGASKNFGRSRSGREVSFHLKEAAEAEGTGNAAVAAASAALVAKEEGRRLDSLLLGAVDAMKAAADINRQTAEMLKNGFGTIFELLAERTQILEETHVSILESGRDNMVARIEMEGQLMRLQNEIEQREDDDPAKQLFEMLLHKHAPQLAGRRPRRPPHAPGANGAAKP